MNWFYFTVLDFARTLTFLGWLTEAIGITYEASKAMTGGQMI